MNEYLGRGWRLLLAPWQEAIRHVTSVDAMITDPPYGRRTHDGNSDVIAATGRAELTYDFWLPSDVFEFVGAWAPKVCGWFACMTS